MKNIENNIINGLPTYNEVVSYMKEIESDNFEGFFNFCEKYNLYEVFTKEYIYGLYDEINNQNNINGNNIVLEVGSGTRNEHHSRNIKIYG